MIEAILAFLQTPYGLIFQFVIALIIFLRSLWGIFNNTLMLGYLRMGNGLVALVYISIALVSGFYVYSLLLPMLTAFRNFFN